jgi:hypothetical protein
MIKYCFHSLEICHQIYIKLSYCPELPIWPKIKNPLWKFLSGTLCFIYFVFIAYLGLLLKFPCRLIYLWTFFFCCTLIRDSHLFGAQEYLVWKRRSNLAQFWFSKSISKISQIFLIFFIEEYENGRTNVFLSFLITLIFYVLYFLKMCTNFDLWYPKSQVHFYGHFHSALLIHCLTLLSSAVQVRLLYLNIYCD